MLQLLIKFSNDWRTFTSTKNSIRASICLIIVLILTCYYLFILIISVEGKDLLELSGIFGNLLPEALDIIDLDKITIHQNLSRHRKYIEIIEDHGTVCKLLPNINYCTCSIFHEKVILSNELYSCKHILAFRLASLIGKVKVREASTDAAFAYSMRMIKPMTDV